MNLALVRLKDRGERLLQLAGGRRRTWASTTPNSRPTGGQYGGLNILLNGHLWGAADFSGGTRCRYGGREIEAAATAVAGEGDEEGAGRRGRGAGGLGDCGDLELVLQNLSLDQSLNTRGMQRQYSEAKLCNNTLLW